MTFYINWAGQNVNYPSGPDTGFPVEVDSGSRFVTPGLTLPAQTLNFVLGSLARAGGTIPSLAINEWAKITPTSAMSSIATRIDCLAWDEVNRLWIAGGHTATALAISADDGQTWNDMPGSGSLPAGTVRAIGPLPSGTGYSVQLGGSTNLQFVTVNGAVTDTGVKPYTFSTGGVAFPNLGFQGVVGVVYDSTNQNTVAYKTTDGTTITIDTSLLPASWSVPAAQPSMSYFASAAGPVQDQLVVFGGTTLVTDPSQVLHVTWNGSSFVYTDIAIPLALANTQIYAVAYNTTQNLWGVLGFNGTNTVMYTTPDLVTWTLASTRAGLLGGLAAVGPYWVYSQLFTTAGVASYRAMSTLDLGSSSPRPLGSSLHSVIFASGRGFLSQGSGNVIMWGQDGSQATRRVGPV